MSTSKPPLDATMADHAPQGLKTIELALPAGPVRVGWFSGASREAVVEAVRLAAHLEPGAAF
ncbi:MAG: hypothetical protein B7Y84_05835, partial [Azorhizobium sp. 32-67-21]